MNWSDIAGTIGKAAPMLGTLLGGPAGAAIGSLISSALGADNDPAAVSAAISQNPEALVKLRQLEADRQVKLQELMLTHAATMAQTEAADRKDARGANVSSGMQPAVFALSIILLLLTLGSEVSVLFLGYPPSIPDLVVGRVLGLLDAVAMMVLAYWFGTTSGSAQKTELLANSTPVK